MLKKPMRIFSHRLFVCFVLQFQMFYLPQQQGGLNEQSSLSQSSELSGGKNSETGNLIFLNESQGSSVLQEHSLSGMQKSYAGISICTSLSSCTIEKSPIVTFTALLLLGGPKQPLKQRLMQRGMQASASPILLQHSHGRHIFASRHSGFATCIFALGFVETIFDLVSQSAEYSEEKTLTLPSLP